MGKMGNFAIRDRSSERKSPLHDKLEKLMNENIKLKDEIQKLKNILYNKHDTTN